MENREFREMLNEVRMVGTLISHDIEERIAKNGKEMIMGNLQVEVVEEVNGEKRIHNHKVRIFSMKFRADGEINGLYKSYKTIKDEYKSKQTHPNEPDRISIVGAIDKNDYLNREGQMVSFNTIEGKFINRLTEPQKDYAVADLEMVVTSLEPKLGTDGLPGNYHALKGLNIGYFSKKYERNMIVPIHEILVDNELAAAIQPFYLPGETVRITLKMNNYATEEKVEGNTGATFGQVVDFSTTKSYVNNYQMAGGHQPHQDELKINANLQELIALREKDLDVVRAASRQPDVSEIPTDKVEATFTSGEIELPDF